MCRLLAERRASCRKIAVQRMSGWSVSGFGELRENGRLSRQASTSEPNSHVSYPIAITRQFPTVESLWRHLAAKSTVAKWILCPLNPKRIRRALPSTAG